MFLNNIFSAFVSSGEGVQSGKQTGNVQVGVQAETSNTLDACSSMRRQDFFKKVPQKLSVSKEFLWSYMLGKYPHWFTYVNTTKISTKEGLLKIEYFEKLQVEISKYIIK